MAWGQGYTQLREIVFMMPVFRGSFVHFSLCVYLLSGDCGMYVRCRNSEGDILISWSSYSWCRRPLKRGFTL